MVLLITTQDTNSRFVQGFLFVCFLSIIVFCNCLESSKGASHPMEIDSPIGSLKTRLSVQAWTTKEPQWGFQFLSNGVPGCW